MFKPLLGCLKDFELEANFKPDAKPIFCDARSVLFAIRDNLTESNEQGIAKGIWTPTDFNDWGVACSTDSEDRTGEPGTRQI